MSWLNILSDGEWHKAKEFPCSSRTIRKYCEENPAEIISLPSLGYRLVQFAEHKEIEHSIHTLRSRAEKLLYRADELDSGR